MKRWVRWPIYHWCREQSADGYGACCNQCKRAIREGEEYVIAVNPRPGNEDFLFENICKECIEPEMVLRAMEDL